MEKVSFEEKQLEEKELKELEETKDDQEKQIEEVPIIGKNRYIEAIGRRKRSIARVRIYDNFEKNDQIKITVNDRDYENYFQTVNLKKFADAPLRKLKIFGAYKIIVKVKGGGLRGQADAIKLGIARALVKINPEWKPRLKKSGLLTRDSRKKERKKYGLKKARKAPQWHKR